MKMHRFLVALVFSVALLLSCDSAFGKLNSRDAVYPLLKTNALKRVKSLVKNNNLTISFEKGTTESQKRYIIDVLTGKKKATREAEFYLPGIQLTLGCPSDG